MFYSYCIKVRGIEDQDHGRKLSEFRTSFNQYILRKYGRQFYDEYCVFHMLNKDNKTLIRALDKKQTVFLNTDILGLLPEGKISVQKSETGRDVQKDNSSVSWPGVVQTGTPKTERKPQNTAPAAVIQPARRPVQPVVRKDPYVDYTAGRIYDTLPARNIDYIPPSFSKRNFKITMRRLMDGSEFVVYHQGKDANEAMALANRHSFDSATIIRVEEDGKT